MGFARKYILNVTNYTSHGIGADAVTTQYDLTGAFSGVTNTGTGIAFSYQAITVASLGTMSIEAYNQRLSDFLSYTQIDSNTQKNNLLTEAVVDDPSCDLFPCQLNNNFTVYKFLTGVRIINIGTTYGVAEYAVYLVPPPTPTSTTSTTLSPTTTTTTSTTSTTTTTTTPIVWTTNPTFLNLNPALTYIAMVRDNLNGIIMCITPPKTFIINNLIPSTTTTSTSTSTTTHTTTIAPTTIPPTTIAPATKYVSWGDFCRITDTASEQEWRANLIITPPIDIGDTLQVRFGTCAWVELAAGTLPHSLCAYACAYNDSGIDSSANIEMPVGACVGTSQDINTASSVSYINNGLWTPERFCAIAYTCRPNNLFTDRCAVVYFDIVSCSGSNFVTDAEGSTFCITSIGGCSTGPAI